MPKTIHPTSRTLLAYLDGELPVDERSDVKTHLNRCESCRDELDTMEADLDWFLVLEAASRTPEPPLQANGLTRLLAATRDWETSRSAAQAAEEQARREKEQQALRALEVFFGSGVAAALQKHETESAESLLTTFLGKRAADALITDIRHRRYPRLVPSDLS